MKVIAHLDLVTVTVTLIFLFRKIRKFLLDEGFGRAIAQAVSRWLPTAASRVRARVWSSGICGGQIGAVKGFQQVRTKHNTN
jgi:hypothetical protein